MTAIETSATNKTCYFLNGTYTQTASINLSASDNNETLAAYPGATPIFFASSGGALTNILTLNATQFFTIQGITFTGVTTVASNGAVTLTNAGNVKFIGNTFTNDDTGIRLNGSSKVLISGNTFGGTLTTSGVYLNSTGSSSPFTYNTGVVIDSNKCSGVVGGLYGYYTTTGCVFATGSVGLRVTHNYFHDIGGSAISLADAASLGNNEVNLEFEVAYNKIVNANNNASAADTGAIYVDGRSGAAIYGSIHDNYVNDVIPSSTSNVVMGIYLDDFSSYVEVYNNITNGGNFACEIHGGEYNYLHNNIFDIGNTSASNLGVCIIQGETGGPISSMVGDIFALNIIYSTAPALSGFSAWNFEGGSSSQGTFYGTNIYYNTNGQTIGESPETGAVSGINPGFVNQIVGWYEFVASSTIQSAYGFLQINQPVIGLAPTTPTAP